MKVMFELPAAFEAELGSDAAELGNEAREALLVSLVRRGKLSLSQFAASLGIEAETYQEVLRRHGIDITERGNNAEDAPLPEAYIESLRRSADELDAGQGSELEVAFDRIRARLLSMRAAGQAGEK